MSKKQIPAFPTWGEAGDHIGTGMTLRDYFAAHASEDDIAQYRVYGAIPHGGITREMARFCYADAMLLARAQS